jgi:hypothetical protein
MKTPVLLVSLLAIGLQVLFPGVTIAGDVANPSQPKAEKSPYQIVRIQPQPSPVPALRYRLDVEMRNQEGGNALPVYYRSFAPDWQAIDKQREWSKKFVEWRDLPLEKLPKEIQALRSMKYLREIDRAASRSYMDWEMVPSIRREGVNLVIPDVQAFSGFIRLLSLRCRAELMEKDFPAAVGTLRTMLTLGRHCDHGPSIIHSLVGVAASDEACLRIQEAIGQPGFPNLYWALMAIPETPIQMRNSMDGEKIIIDSALPGIREMVYSRQRFPLREQELLVMLSKLEMLVNTLDRTGRIPREGRWFSQPVLPDRVKPLANKAREKLLAFGISENDLVGLPDIQLIFMAEVLIFDEKSDEQIKWLNIPFSFSKKTLVSWAENNSNGKMNSDGGIELGFLGTFLSSGYVHSLQTKAGHHRRFAVLRVIEAIRLHAVETGKWPESLSEIDSVYVPLDPVTGKTFTFRKEQDAIWLVSTPLPSEEKKPEMWTWKLELLPFKSSGN